MTFLIRTIKRREKSHRKRKKKGDLPEQCPSKGWSGWKLLTSRRGSPYIGTWMIFPSSKERAHRVCGHTDGQEGSFGSPFWLLVVSQWNWKQGYQQNVRSGGNVGGLKREQKIQNRGVNGLRSVLWLLSNIRSAGVHVNECGMRPIMYLFSPITSIIQSWNTTGWAEI